MRDWVYELTAAALLADPNERSREVERLLGAFEEDVVRRSQEAMKGKEVNLLADDAGISTNEAAIRAALALEASSREEVQEIRRDVYDRLAQSSGREWLTAELLREAARFVLPIHTPAFTRTHFLRKFIITMEDGSEAPTEIWWRDPYDGSLAGPRRTRNDLLKQIFFTSERMSPEFGWDAASMFTFIVTGYAPVTRLLRARLDAGGMACSAHLVLRVNLALDAKRLEAAYRNIKAALLREKHFRSAPKEAQRKIAQLGEFFGPTANLFEHPAIGEALMRFAAMELPEYGAVRSRRTILEPQADAQAYHDLQNAKLCKAEAARVFFDRLEILIEAKLKENGTNHEEETRLTLPNVFAVLGRDPLALSLWDSATMPDGWSLQEAEERCSALSNAHEANDPGPYLSLYRRFPFADAWIVAEGADLVRRELIKDWKANSVQMVEWLSAKIEEMQRMNEFLSPYGLSVT